MDDLIFRKQTIKALEEWEKIYTWDDWCRMHNDEKEEYNIIAPSDVLKKLPPAQPEISRIEQALHGKTPEEQYEFIYWLLFKFALTYTDSRRAVIEWLKGDDVDAHD